MSLIYPLRFFKTYENTSGNEEHVGKAIRELDVPREDIFVTTKLGYVVMFLITLPEHKWLMRIQLEGVATGMSLAASTPPSRPWTSDMWTCS